MRNEEVLYDIESLDAHSPLIERVRQEYFPEKQILSRVERRWYGNRDAAVGGNLTFAYFDKGWKLPKEIGWSAVRRAYQCLISPTQTRRTDPICHAVLDFAHPINLRAQAILQGYLAAGLSYEQVAVLVGRSVDFVRLFANLFFDFPERCESLEFVDAVLDPKGERGCFKTDLADLIRIENPVLRLTNIGFHYGVQGLRAEIGRAMDQGHTLSSESESLKDTNRWLLFRARRKAMAGQLALEDPEFAIVKALNQQRPQSSCYQQQPTQLEALSLSTGAQATLNDIFQQQINSQLQAQTGVSSTEESDYQI